MKSPVSILLAYGLSLILVTAARAADPPASVELRYHLPPSSAYSYQTTLKLQGQVKMADEPKPDSLAAEMDMRQRMRVVSSEEKTGNLTLEHRLFDLKLTNNGQVVHADDAPPITTVIDPNGKLLEARGLEKLSGANVMPGLDPTTFTSLLCSLPTFPTKPVKIGDSWSDDMPVQLPTGQKATAKRKLTLVALETEKDGRPSARIHTEISLPINATVEGDNGGTLTGAQTGSGESRILLADGLPLESQTEMKMDLVAKPTKPLVDDKGHPKDSSVQVTTAIHVAMKRVPDQPPKASTDTSKGADTTKGGDASKGVDSSPQGASGSTQPDTSDTSGKDAAGH